MEKLSAAQQAQLKKMSNERLSVKLMAAGYEEDLVIGYEGDVLLLTYAEIIASGRIRTGPVTYDSEVEKTGCFLKDKSGRQKWKKGNERKNLKDKDGKQIIENGKRKWS